MFGYCRIYENDFKVIEKNDIYKNNKKILIRNVKYFDYFFN